MTKIRVSYVATCSQDDPRTNVIAIAPHPVVLYIGVSENARNEEKELKAASKACVGRLRIDTVEPNGAEDNKGQTSIEHMLAWLAESQGDAHRLTTAAKRMRNAMVLQGDEIYRLHTFKGDLRR